MKTNNQSQNSQVNSNKQIGLRKFTPMIIQTKEELMTAMKQGRIKTSKYNLLDEKEKLFAELVCFGGYTGEQAARVIFPGSKNPTAIANRLMSNPELVDTINELTTAKDKLFSAEIASDRDLAREKLRYIMLTTSDEALAASCAKILLDKAESTLKNNVAVKEDESVGGIRFNIHVDNVNVNGAESPKSEEPVIIELSPEDINKAVGREVVDENGELTPEETATVNPETGLPYVLKYEGIDNYK